MSSYRSYVPWNKSGLSSSYSGPSSSNYGSSKTSDSGISSSTSQYDGGGYGRRLSSGSVNASPTSSSYLSGSSYRPYLSRGSTSSYLKETSGKEASATSERRDSKDSDRMSLLDKYTSGTYPGRRDNYKEDLDKGSSSYRAKGRSLSIKSRDKTSRDPSPEPTSTTIDIGSKSDRVGYGTSLSPYRLYSRNTYSRSTSRDSAPDTTSSTSSTPATTPVHTPSSLRFSSSSRYGSNIIRSPVSEKTQPIFGLSSHGYGGKSVSRSNSQLDTEGKKTSLDPTAEPSNNKKSNATIEADSESSESNEDEDISEEEVKQTTFITVVTRGTSPTPPSSSSYIRSRRSELARVIEKTIAKPKSRPEMADKEVQSDRGDDTARLSRYGVSSRWASYLDRYPSAASSYSPVSRYSSRFNYTPRNEKDSGKSEEKESSTKASTQDSSNSSNIVTDTTKSSSSVTMSKDSDKVLPGKNLKSDLSISKENRVDSSNKSQLSPKKSSASKTEEKVTNITKPVESKEASDIASKTKDSTKVFSGSKIEMKEPVSKGNKTPETIVDNGLTKVKSIKNVLEKSEENNIVTDKVSSSKSKLTSTLNSELISSKPKIKQSESKTTAETEKESAGLTRVKSVKDMTSKQPTPTGTETPAILRTRRSSSISEGSSTPEGSNNSQEHDKEPPVLARIKSFKNLKSVVQTGNETPAGLKSKSSSSASLSQQISSEKLPLTDDPVSKTEESKEITNLTRNSTSKNLSGKPPIPNATQGTETPLGLKNKSASSASLCSEGAQEKYSTNEGNLSRNSSEEGFLSKTSSNEALLSKTSSNEALLSKTSSNEGLPTKSTFVSTSKSKTDTSNKLPPPVPKNDSTPGLKTSSSMHSLSKLGVANKDFRKSPLNVDLSNNALQADALKKMQEKKFKRSSSTSSGDSETFCNDVDATPALPTEKDKNTNLIKGSKSLTKLHFSSSTSKISSSNSDLKDTVPKRKSPVRTKSRNDVNKDDSESSESSSESSSTESSTSASETSGSEDEDEGLMMKNVNPANIKRRPSIKNSKKTLAVSSMADISAEQPPKPPSSPKPTTEDEPKSFLMRALAPVANFFRGKQESSNENSTEEIPRTESAQSLNKVDNFNIEKESKSEPKTENSITQKESDTKIYEKESKKPGLKYKLRKNESGERAWWLESNPNIPEGIKRIESNTSVNKLKDLEDDSNKLNETESDKNGSIKKTPSVTSMSKCKDLEPDAAKPPIGEKLKKKFHRLRHEPSGDLPWWLDNSAPTPEGVKRIESNTSINKLVDSDGDSKKSETGKEGIALLKDISLSKGKDSDQDVRKPPIGEDKVKIKLHRLRHQQSGELPWWLDSSAPVPEGVVKNVSNISVNKLVDSDGDGKKLGPGNVDKIQGIHKTSSNSSLNKSKDSDPYVGKPPTGEDKNKKKNFKIRHQQSDELPWWLDNNTSIPEGIQKIQSNSSVNKLLDSDAESKKTISNKYSDSDSKKSSEIKRMKSNTSVKKLLDADIDSKNKDDIRSFGYRLRKQESGEKAWWLNSSADIPEGVKKLTSESSEESEVEEKKDKNSGSSVPKFPLVLPTTASNGDKSRNKEESGRQSPYDNLQEQDHKPAKSTKVSRPKNLPLFIGNHTNIDDILGTAVTLVNPVMGLSRLRKKLENQGTASSNEEDSGGEFSECEEVDPRQVRIHDSTAKKPQIKRLGDSTDGSVTRRNSGTNKLDDTALQLYKDGDYGSYLDLEASISEQQEEFDDFQTNRKNSIVLRTQLSVRVHTIIEKLLNSEGRELRRALFSLKQTFQEDKDLVHEFVQNDGLACLIKVGSEADQNYQNYILRALGQVMLYVDGMNGVMEHNETVQWLYALIASKFRLVVKTALKLLLVFVEYVETNCLLLIKAVHAVDKAHGLLPWSNIVKLLKDYDAADTELLIYAMTLVNKTLNGIPDQDTYYDQVDSLEEQGIEGTIQRYMSKQGTDLDLLRQFQIYEAVLHHEDGEEKGTPLKQLDETVRKTLRNRKSLTESMTAERRKSRRHSTGTSPMSSSLSTSARINNSSLQNSTVADDDESESSSCRSSPGPELNGSYKESKMGDAGVTPALRRRRERAERQRSFIREQQETAATLKATLGSPDEGGADENVRLCQRLGNGSLDNGEARSSNKLQQLNRTSSRKDMTPLMNAVNKMQDAKSGQESPEGNGILKKPWVLSMMYGKNSAEEGGEEALLDGENDLDDAATSERKKLLQLKRENTVKDLTQKLSSQNLIHSPVEEGNNKSINRIGDMTGLISKAKEGLAKSKSKEMMKSPTNENIPKMEPKKSETELHWEELVQSLKRPLSLCDLDFTDLKSDDEVDILSPANITNGGPPPPPPVPMAPGMPSPQGGAAPPPPPPATRFGSIVPPPMPTSVINPPPPFGVNLRSQRSTLGNTTSPDKSNTPPSTPIKKTKKTVKLFWKEVRDDPIILAKLQRTGMIWDELNPVSIDTQKLEHLFESRAKDLITKKQQEMNKNKEIIVLDHKRSNAINIGMTKLPPPRSIKTAILKMDATIMNREGIEKLLTMLPTEEERSKIQEAQVANPDMPLGSAEQFLLTLASISELPARLKLWAFKLDFENSEKEIAEPLMDLKQGMETLKSNKTFRGILSTLLSIGIFLNGNEVKGFQIEYLAKVPEVKDTVHKHSLLHHLCHMVMEKFSDSSDLYSEIGAITRASKVDFDELAVNVQKLEQECKASWDHLKVIAKHDGSTMKVKMSDFLADCAERIIVLGIVHRRVMNRFHKFLLWLGIPLHRVADTKPNEFCRIVSEFSLEYRTTRERVLQQLEKKANHRERNKTRGKMITEVGKFRTKEDRADAELRQLLGSDISEVESIHGTLPWRRQRRDLGRTVLSPLAREESVNGNLTDGDDEILESLVKTATKAPTTRTTPRERKRTRHADRKSYMNPEENKPEHFQVCMTILEARHLAWATMNPVVCIQIDKQTKYTATKESTDCPFYNEYFVFDFYLPFPLFLEKSITISVIHARGFGRRNKTLGKVQFDVATVWKQSDHQFYHKWAMLFDHNDPSACIKGYLKCDITIIGKGDVVKVHPAGVEKDDDDIEGNLLVSEGVTSQQQRACYMIYVYRAEIVTEAQDSIDPYVEVSFAGLKGRTSIRSNNNAPMWNEILDFNYVFPPLWQRIKIQIRDSNVLSNNVIATHLLDLPTVSSDRDTIGFLPTFGPSFINLYGASNIQKSSSPRSHAETWVTVLGDGASYRGRLLLALETELLVNVNTLRGSGKRGVTLRSVAPVIEKQCWRLNEYLLVGVVWEISMLDRRYKNKQVHVEISLGSTGNMAQTNFLPPIDLDTLLDNTSDLKMEEPSSRNPNPKLWSTTEQQQLELRDDKNYCSLPYEDAKPCIFVHSKLPDTRHRIYHSNLLTRLAHRLGNIMNISKGLQENLSKNKIETILNKLQDILKKLNLFMEDPQHSLPDLFVWLIVDGKRTAFYRTAARHLMFSILPEEKGMNCGHLQTILMKALAKAGESSVDETILPAKIDIALWLGRSKHAHTCFKSLATGYETLDGFGPHHLCHERYPVLPREIRYAEKHKFEFRAYIHQGRLKPGSDTTALCDAFVRVVLGGWSKDTQIEKASLNPTWDQTLIVKEVVLPGAAKCLKSQPPVIVVEVYDMDVSLLQSRTELVGRTTARPHVRLAEETYISDDYMPELQWYQLRIGNKITGEILVTFELLEVSDTLKGPELPQDLKSKVAIYRLPEQIKPCIVKYRMEVLFWGLRDMKKLNMFTSVKKPQVTAECQDLQLHSTVIGNANHNSNFTQPLQFWELELPKQSIYHPPLTFTINDQHSFGRSKYVGTHIQHSVSKFLVVLDTQEQHAAKLQSVVFPQLPSVMEHDVDENISQNDSEATPLLKTITRRGTLTSIPGYDSTRLFAKRNLKKILNPLSKLDENTNDRDEIGIEIKEKRNTEEKKLHFEEDDEDESFDWWAKYYASLKISDEEPFDFLDELLSQGKRDRRRKSRKKVTLKIYPMELETQPEFSNFNDFLQCFEIYRGKTIGDEILDRENIVGTLKGTVKLYQWPPPEEIEIVTKTGLSVADGGILQDMPTNDPVRVLVRVYVVRASGLHSKDLSGKSDPYLMVELGKTVISDNENYIPRQLNPIFGRYFELVAVFPMDYMLTIRVMDNDIAATDDLIGETKIDLENRFYSQHRASCGIASYYNTSGYNKWRDSQKPTEILERLCRKHRINSPVYGNDKVVLGGNTTFDMTDLSSEAKIQLQEEAEEEYKHEILALYALHRWHEVPYIGYHLVPEHVETRSLFHPEKLGIEQGKIELWVDMFPVSELPPPPPVDIAPRKAQEYELRMIVWNTEDVVLQEDSFVSGERMSDIYVRGWLMGKEDMQYTDVHYRSLTGEGNFNWRFVFKFSYLSAEDKIVTTKQESFFTSEVTEFKSPCRLNVQVFDNDTFSKDDFLGTLIMDLANMPRGARTAKKCNLNMLKKDAPKINIFKIHRTKGWWPFKASSEDKITLTGKVEMEFELVSSEEAEKNPVGIGRSPPEALPKPKRPETSFLWFKNPWRSLQYILWQNYRWCLLKTLIFIIFILFIAIGIYSVPGYTIKRILGA